MIVGNAVRRRIRLGMALGLIMAPAVVLAGGPSHADASYTAHADSQSFHITVTNDMGSIPTLPQIDAGVGTASVSFTSFGGGVARAASPDAGSAASVPALLGALVPTLVPVPLPFTLPSIQIPGDITVQAGQKPARVGTGPYALSAAVTDTSATATAVLGGAVDEDNGVLKTSSTASVTVAKDDSVTTTATASISGLKINGLISIGDVSSKALVTRTSSGELQRSATTEIGLISVAGLTLSYRDGHFVLPVASLPVPVEQVMTLISSATGGKIKIEITPAHNTPNGIVAGSVQIIQKVPPPPKCVAIPLPTPIVSGVTYCGTTTVVYDLGKASVSADYAVIPDIPTGGTPVPPSTTPGGTTTDPGGSTSGDLPVYAPPVGSVDVPVTSPVTTPMTQEQQEQQQQLLAVSARFVDMSNLYLALVGFALLILISSTCLRLLGVRNKWTS